MSNNATYNPIIIDSTGVVKSVNMQISGVGVRASGDNWVVKLRGTGAALFNTIFDQAGSVTGDRGGYFPINVQVQGLYAETLTAITEVLVYENAV